MTVKRDGRTFEVSALNWAELELAFRQPQPVLAACVAGLVRNGFIDSERTFASLWQALKGKEPPTFYWITPAGLTFLKRLVDTPPSRNEPGLKSTPVDLDSVEEYAKYLGYDLTRYGLGVACLSLKSGYSQLETASRLALVTLAWDVKEAGTDIVTLIAFVPHARSMVDILTQYQKQHPGLMREELFKNDALAMLKVVMVDQDQRAWIERVLSDPTIASERVANSRIDYRKLSRGA